ncbi:MAG: hypothetical protein KAI28_02850 [Sphingomonadales bacterium]|nr:hypothetical protein [Sphingomonadales bacterium]
MDHENALLEERKYRELEKIQPEKSRLAAEYNIAMQALRPFKNMLQHDHQDIRNELTKANEAFQDKVTNNGRHLMRSKSISEGIISSIAQEAERQSPTVKQYNPMHPNGGASQTRSVPIAINETV